jgi:hypothetical protein
MGKGQDNADDKKKKKVRLGTTEVKEFKFDPNEEVIEGRRRELIFSAGDPYKGSKNPAFPKEINIPVELRNKHELLSEMINLTNAYLSIQDFSRKTSLRFYENEDHQELYFGVLAISDALKKGEIPDDPLLQAFSKTLISCPIDPEFPSEKECIDKAKALLSKILNPPSQKQGFTPNRAKP